MANVPLAKNIRGFRLTPRKKEKGLQCRDCPLHLKCLSLGKGKGPTDQCSVCGKIIVCVDEKTYTYVTFYCSHLSKTCRSATCGCGRIKCITSVVYNLSKPNELALYKLRAELPKEWK